MKERCRTVTEEAKKRHNESSKAWKAAHPEKVKEQQRRYRETHREQLYAQQKAWRKANPEKSAAIYARYWQKKLQAAEQPQAIEEQTEEES